MWIPYHAIVVISGHILQFVHTTRNVLELQLTPKRPLQLPDIVGLYYCAVSSVLCLAFFWWLTLLLTHAAALTIQFRQFPPSQVPQRWSVKTTEGRVLQIGRVLLRTGSPTLFLTDSVPKSLPNTVTFRNEFRCMST